MVQSSDCKTPDLEAELNKIAEKVPVLDALQNKVQEFKELDPELQSVNKQLDFLTDWSDMDAAKLGGETIRQIYHAQDLPTTQPVKEMIKSQILHNYEANKAGLAVKNVILDSSKSAKTTLPALSSVGEMSNFLGAATSTTSDPDITKMVEGAFEKHHLTEKLSNLKSLQNGSTPASSDTDDKAADTSAVVAKSMKEHHLTEKIANLKAK